MSGTLIDKDSFAIHFFIEPTNLYIPYPTHPLTSASTDGHPVTRGMMHALRPSRSSNVLWGGAGSVKGPVVLQRSSSEVIYKRGFKPSDRHDPGKKQFLTDLSTKMWRASLVSTQA